MPAASLRALLEHSIDYAGLFPPATLALEPALQNQAAFVRTADAWMLGAFILPVAQFESADGSISRFDREHPLRVSALGKKADEAATFKQSLIGAKDSIRTFREKHGAAAAITQLEMPLPDDTDAELLKAARAILGELHLNIFWEAPADEAARQHPRTPCGITSVRRRSSRSTPASCRPWSPRSAPVRSPFSATVRATPST